MNETVAAFNFNDDSSWECGLFFLATDECVQSEQKQMKPALKLEYLEANLLNICFSVHLIFYTNLSQLCRAISHNLSQSSKYSHSNCNYNYFISFCSDCKSTLIPLLDLFSSFLILPAQVFVMIVFDCIEKSKVPRLFSISRFTMFQL